MFSDRVNSKMENFGLAIHLSSNEAALIIDDNNFTDILMDFEGVCVASESDGQISYAAGSNWWEDTSWVSRFGYQLQDEDRV